MLLVMEKLSFYMMNFMMFLLCIALFTLMERKAMSSVQRRKGPNLTGLFGFSQPFADGLKLLLKEMMMPSNANMVIFTLSPVFTFFFTMCTFFMLPFNTGYMMLESSFSILIMLAISSLSVHSIIFSGWSSNSKYAFLGSMRSASQMISYELCISTMFLSMVLFSGSFSIMDVVKHQEYMWYCMPLLPFWMLFLIVALAETNSAPFDLPEAEAELVAGYNVEYSSMLFAMFFLAEYGNILMMSSISTLFFLGGWKGIFFMSNFAPTLVFAIKVSLHVLLFIFVRAAYPRYSYDHLMKMGWKMLLPLSFFLLMLESNMMLLFNMFTSL